jgi:hypothetical protein
MHTTLIELARIHKYSFVVRDAFTHSWYLIIGASSTNEVVFEAKKLQPNTFSAVPGSEVVMLYGGYSRWIYIGPERKDGISFEDQKRIRKEQMKRQNDGIVKDLRRGHAKKKAQAETEKKAKDPGQTGKVIQFPPRKT